MSILSFVYNTASVVVFYVVIFLTEKNQKKVLKLEQEKALRIGHDAGVNWALDLSVDEYVFHQQKRKNELHPEK